MALNMLKVMMTETFKHHPQRCGPYIIIYPMPIDKFIVKPLVPVKQFCQRKMQFSELKDSTITPVIFRPVNLQHCKNVQFGVHAKAVKKK